MGKRHSGRGRRGSPHTSTPDGGRRRGADNGLHSSSSPQNTPSNGSVKAPRQRKRGERRQRADLATEFLRLFSGQQTHSMTNATPPLPARASTIPPPPPPRPETKDRSVIPTADFVVDAGDPSITLSVAPLPGTGALLDSNPTGLPGLPAGIPPAPPIPPLVPPPVPSPSRAGVVVEWYDQDDMPSNLRTVEPVPAPPVTANSANPPATPRMTPVPLSSPQEGAMAPECGNPDASAQATQADPDPECGRTDRRQAKGRRRAGALSTTTTDTSTTSILAVRQPSPPPPKSSEEVFVFTATEATNATAYVVAEADAGPSNDRKRKAEKDVEVITLDADDVPDEEAAPQPETKRICLDLHDIDLDRAVRLLCQAGASLVYRTGAVPEPYTTSWTLDRQTNCHPEPLRYHPLYEGCEEFATVEQAFLHTCKGKGFRVTGICRIMNDQLLSLFQDQVRQLERSCGDAAVVRIYHGTRRDSVESICRGNLDPLVAGRGSGHFWWGKGVNFSPISFYSSHYCDQTPRRSMVVCDVVVSRVCSVRNPPDAPPLPEDVNRCFDTNIKLDPAPQVVCKFKCHQYYPAYVIDFTAPNLPPRWGSGARGARGARGAPSSYYFKPQPQRWWPWQRQEERNQGLDQGWDTYYQPSGYGYGYRYDPFESNNYNFTSYW